MRFGKSAGANGMESERQRTRANDETRSANGLTRNFVIFGIDGVLYHGGADRELRSLTAAAVMLLLHRSCIFVRSLQLR
jgi:hypothetical protein